MDGCSPQNFPCVAADAGQYRPDVVEGEGAG